MDTRQKTPLFVAGMKLLIIIIPQANLDAMEISGVHTALADRSRNRSNTTRMRLQSVKK